MENFKDCINISNKNLVRNLEDYYDAFNYDEKKAVIEMLKENDISLVKNYISAKHYYYIENDYKNVVVKSNYDCLFAILVYITSFNLTDSYIRCRNQLMYNQLKMMEKE